jgi:hypothetical protein
MPKMKVKGQKVEVKMIYWLIFLSTKIIIVILVIIFILVTFTNYLDPYFPVNQ